MIQDFYKGTMSLFIWNPKCSI